jgi:hypothetical protein
MNKATAADIKLFMDKFVKRYSKALKRLSNR